MSNKKVRTRSEEEKRRRRRSNWGTFFLVMMLLVGLGIMAYPTVSDWWNSFHASRAIASYSTTVESVDKEKLDSMIEAARKYNASLLKKDNPYLMTEEDMEEYNSLLDLSGTGVIGYITIKSIGVYIPVYHGVEESVLQIAVGHIEWTSLPVGGESTHSVLSGHRGLPSAKLFTDLDQMKEGDRFTVTVLNQMITYEVDQIRIVEPGDVSELAIVPGKDYCTLVTCTPYGINTHRMLVRGHRVANEAGEMVVAPEAFRIPNYFTIPAVGIPLLFLFLIGMLIYYRRRSPSINSEQMRALIRELPTPEQLKAQKRAEYAAARKKALEEAQAREALAEKEAEASTVPAEEQPEVTSAPTEEEAEAQASPAEEKPASTDSTEDPKPNNDADDPGTDDPQSANEAETTAEEIREDSHVNHEEQEE